MTLVFTFLKKTFYVMERYKKYQNEHVIIPKSRVTEKVRCYVSGSLSLSRRSLLSGFNAAQISIFVLTIWKRHSPSNTLFLTSGMSVFAYETLNLKCVIHDNPVILLLQKYRYNFSEWFQIMAFKSPFQKSYRGSYYDFWWYSKYI